MKQCPGVEADFGMNVLTVGVHPSGLFCEFFFISPGALRSNPNHKSNDSRDHIVHFIAVLFSIWKISPQNVLEILKR